MTVRAPLIRPARRVDIGQLTDVWLQLMHMHEAQDHAFALADDGLAQWQQMAYDMLDRDDTFVLVADYGGNLVGFCLGWIARNPPIYAVSDVGFISELAVAQSHRGCGVGKALVAAARRWFSRRHLMEFQLSTAVWNQTAQDFWQAVGGAPLLVRYRFDVHPSL
jgi:ribosomal protein S18 acetylase RimI-like enzyme